MSSRLDALNQWVLDVARLTRPDAIHWCDGSDTEHDALVARMQADGTLIKLNEQTHPDSWLHRSHPDDVARVEHLTFVCTPEQGDAGFRTFHVVVARSARYRAPRVGAPFAPRAGIETRTRKAGNFHGEHVETGGHA